MCDHGIYIFEETEKSIQDIFGDVFSPEVIVQDEIVSMSIHGKRMV